MESSEFTVGIKNVDAMIAGLKKAAKAGGFEFKGDNKSGSASNAGASIRYLVTDQKATFTVKITWDMDELQRFVKDWIRPYQ
jgi:hypothetical protein